MRRLVWVGVGAVVTVVVIRQGRRLVEQHLPAGTVDVVEGVGRLRGAVATARREFAAGLAEREQQLRHDLVGDVDVDELRAQRPRHVDELRRTWSTGGRAPGRDVPKDWRAAPTDDPDDDDGYAFF